MSWQVVVPVKSSDAAKSRLGASPALALAIAVDTVAAVAAAPGVGRVVVVTADEGVAWELRGIDGVQVVPELASEGIASAVSLGLDMIEETEDRAILLGDLPALASEDLAAALALASRVTRGFVPDREGGGTTMVTATAGSELLHRFGAGSAARHAALGLVRLGVPKDSTLRRDVDTPEHLDAARAQGLGPRTLAALAAGPGSGEDPPLQP
ncbi:MAG: 2-phospho-L-lactate guanylyltransferase [Micrococcales bacterium]|nr:2-phospho-L-lactate guanylyltransferase [Micrococcales bacterium]